MKYNSLLIILLFLFSFSVYSQENNERPKTNLELINSILQRDFEDCIEYINILGSEKKYLIKDENQNEVNEYLIKLFKRTYVHYKFFSDEKKAESDYVINFKNVKIETLYNFENNNLIFDKYIQRQIFCGFTFSISDNDSILYNNDFTNQIKDTIDYIYIDYIESDNYQFTKGIMPKEGFWDKYLIPGSAILVSAIAIILFFTIRSK